MNKILLVYEDYADLMSVENTLKKVGFDVIGLTNEYTVAEQVLAFNPDLVVGSGRGGKVSSLGVGKRLKEMHRWQGKSVLIFPANFKPEPQDLIRIRVDMMLESPVPAVRLVQVIGKLLGHDETVLLDRLNKASVTESAQKSTTSGGTSVAGKFSMESEAIYIKGRTEDVQKNAEERALHAEKISEDSVSFPLDAEASDERKKKFSFRFGDRMSESVAGKPASPEARTEAGGTLFEDVDLKALEREILGGGAPDMERIEAAELEEPSAPDEKGIAEVAEKYAATESLEGESEDSVKSEATSKMTEAEKASEFKLSAGSAGEETEGSQRPSSVAVGKDNILVSGDVSLEVRDLQAKAREDLERADKDLKKRISKYAEIVSDVKVAPKSTVSRVEARRRLVQMQADWDSENLKELDKLRREFTKALFKK